MKYLSLRSAFVSIMTLGIIFLVYSYFVERQLIIVRETQIETGFSSNIGLIGDLHLGKWKDEEFLKRVVKKINQQDIDYLLIAGDFTYYPTTEQKLGDLFGPLADINVPTYAVLGNHDVGEPGPALRDELAKALELNDVNLLNNQVIKLNTFTLIGLGDAWINEDDVNVIDDNQNSVVLAHNPDTITKYTEKTNLTLTGHTHCGQIRIPWLYKYVIPTEGHFDKGFSEEVNTNLYITCGLGEVGLPLRLFNPPVIDVLNLY